MGLADRVQAEEADQAAAQAERATAAARRDASSARAALKISDARVEELTAELNILSGIADLNPSPPKWLAPARPKAGNRAIVTTLLSDLHLDEVVNPDEMGGVNAFDRDIATLRLRRYFERTIMLGRDYSSGVTIEGAAVLFAGDNITGEIHDELARTNADSIPGTLLYWSEQLAAGLDMLADEWGKVACFESPGNHGRMSRKVEPKQFARRSFDWLLMNMVANLFRRDPRVEFTITEGYDSRFTIYDTTYLLHHGLTGGSSAGSGIGGIWPTIMRDDARRRNAYQAVRQPYDIAAMGHWHQYTWGPGQAFVINGSLKGYDEFARHRSFGFEPPQQAWWLTTPQHGVTFTAPVLVQDRKREGW